MLSFELIQPLREDAEQIRIWRNDPFVLKMSFTYIAPKPLEEFYPQFLRQYFSYPALPSLFITQEGVRVGVLRFDPVDDDKSCEISILISKEKRGQRIGSLALEAIEPFLIRKAIHKIKARIKEAHAVSQRLFEKNGYALVRKSEGVFFYEKKLSPFVDSDKIFVIAEAGSNWKAGTREEDKARGFKMIEAAKEAGADAIKFQTFRAEEVYVSNAGQSDYLHYQGIAEDIFTLFQRLEMPDKLIPLLASHCQEIGIEFMSSVFSIDDFEKINPFVKRHKIASYEISHLRLLEKIAKSGKPLILSTGASSLEDIDWAVDVFYRSGGTHLTLLQCTAQYPAAPEAMHLKTIPSLRARYLVPIGLSDHSLDPIVAPLGAVSLGAKVVEKHFTLDRSFEGPDHRFAVTPEELKTMVASLRTLEKMGGTPLKEIYSEETELYHFARRGIQAIRDIEAGETFKEGYNIAVLRPGKKNLGVHPKWLEEIQGKRSTRRITKGCGITQDDIYKGN